MAETDRWKNATRSQLDTIHEKLCPVCGRYVEVFPDLGWEIEWHEQRHFNGRQGKCSAVGTRLPTGNSRKRVVTRIHRYKGK